MQKNGFRTPSNTIILFNHNHPIPTSHSNESIRIQRMTEMARTMFLDSMWMTSARPIFFIPIWSNIARIMATINPTRHSSAPMQQMKKSHT